VAFSGLVCVSAFRRSFVRLDRNNSWWSLKAGGGLFDILRLSLSIDLKNFHVQIRGCKNIVRANEYWPAKRLCFHSFTHENIDNTNKKSFLHVAIPLIYFIVLRVQRDKLSMNGEGDEIEIIVRQ
jgi:hypothetical protein